MLRKMPMWGDIEAGQPPVNAFDNSPRLAHELGQGFSHLAAEKEAIS
jgi:hypothetical protein